LFSLDVIPVTAQSSSRQAYIVFRKPSKLAAEKIAKRFGTFVKTEGDDMVIRSWLEPHRSVTGHLNWLFAKAKFERKAFLQLEAAGEPAILVIRSHTRPLVIQPEALLLAHQLHLVTEIHLSK
jgi:hypothetical protein